MAEFKEEIRARLFGECWDKDTMMGKFLAEHVSIESGDIDPLARYAAEGLSDQLDNAEAVFVDLVATFIEANGGSLR